MEESFSEAATATPTKFIVMTFDWDGTLYDPTTKTHYFELIDLACDVKASGNHALINTSSELEKVIDWIPAAIKAGAEAGFDFSVLAKAPIYKKDTIKILTDHTKDQPNPFHVDYAFDNVKIEDQLNYVEPNHEISVGVDFTTSPMTLDEIRAATGIPRRPRQDSAPSAPTFSPVHP